MTARQVAAMTRSKEVSCEEIATAALDRIQAVEPQIRAFITLMADQAIGRARDLDRRLASGENPGPLCGVPIALKDNLSLQGAETTCGSRILKGYVPPYNATAVDRLLAAGAIPIGKTNMDEFAMGSSTENSAFFPTRNPWNTACVPGGSSGGSAAAVASGQVPVALGSDTGGSIRQPAAFCGIAGLKPTYGRVSRYGLVAFASSLDQIGPIAREMGDIALLLGVIAGADPRDSTCAARPAPDYDAALRADVKGLRIGLPREMFGQAVQPAISTVTRRAIQVLEDAGAKIVEVSLPTLDYALPVYYILAPAEASSNLARYDGVEYGVRADRSQDTIGMYMTTRDQGFGNEVKQRILMGTYALSAGYYDAYYLKAQQVRTLVRRDFTRAFEECDILAGPTTPTPAFRIGQKVGDPMEMKLADILTIPANIAGIPALSIPCGQVDGLPVGLDLMARPFDEETLIRCGFTFESATHHHLQRPEISA